MSDIDLTPEQKKAERDARTYLPKSFTPKIGPARYGEPELSNAYQEYNEKYIWQTICPIYIEVSMVNGKKHQCFVADAMHHCQASPDDPDVPGALARVAAQATTIGVLLADTLNRDGSAASAFLNEFGYRKDYVAARKDRGAK